MISRLKASEIFSQQANPGIPNKFFSNLLFFSRKKLVDKLPKVLPSPLSMENPALVHAMVKFFLEMLCFLSPVNENIMYQRIEFQYKWVCHPFTLKRTEIKSVYLYTPIQNNIGPNIGDGINFVTCEKSFRILNTSWIVVNTELYSASPVLICFYDHINITIFMITYRGGLCLECKQ